MHDPDATEFANMALALFNEPDVEHTLERVVEYAQHATACDAAGLILLHGRGRVESAVTTDDRVAQADRMQTDLGEGPCVQAIWQHDAFIIEDTSSDARFPNWGPKAAELGLRSILSVRLRTMNSTVGALNLYGNKPALFDEDDLDIVDIFARHASVALASAREEDGLRQAIGARHLIGQAQGILMERYGLDPERAFALLRRYSRDNNVKLRSVAQHVIESGQLSDG